jgi:hypothetical protein
MGDVATTRAIHLYDVVELLEPVDNAPAGARGGVLEFLRDGTVAEIEILEPKLDGLDAIVYTTLDKLRVVRPHESKSDSAN